MSPGALAVDLIAIIAMMVGFAMVFRQQSVRQAWHTLFARPEQSDADLRPKREEDPAHYALSIFGMMLFAFGLTIFGFVTAFAVLG